jgi:hypothetical protein
VALAAFLQLRRASNTDEDQRAQRIYRSEVEDIVTRVHEMFDGWLRLREYESDNFELANAASVNRWELMRLVKLTERLNPPRSLNTAHRDLQNAVVGAARACQLLANGYRSHKSEAVCDGQALLVETVANLSELVDRLKMRV